MVDRQHLGKDSPLQDPPARGGMRNLEVTIIVEDHQFLCVKEDISRHSNYFKGMFNSQFAENENSKFDLTGSFHPELFQLFLASINGVYSITDENVVDVLELAMYLEALNLEQKCIEFLAEKTKRTLHQQFDLAEKFQSKNLMLQVFSFVEDVQKFDSLVPKDFSSMSECTKSIAIKKSLELLGIGLPPSPPLSEVPDQIFERFVNELIDQAEVHHQQGQILADQAFLLANHVVYECSHRGLKPEERDNLIEDSRIPGLLCELQNARTLIEKNAIRARIQVIQIKSVYTLQNKGHSEYGYISSILAKYQPIIDRGTRSGSQKHESSAPLPDVPREPTWIVNIRETNEIPFDGCDKLIPAGLRTIPNQYSFREIDYFVKNIRKMFYSLGSGTEPKNATKEESKRQGEEVKEPECEISLKELFDAAVDQQDTHRVMQLLTSIRDPYQLNDVVPCKHDSLNSDVKNLVLQTCFRLLGIRQPPAPPLPEEPEQVFEMMMDELLDQLEVQHHHGMILWDNVILLESHIIFEQFRFEDSLGELLFTTFQNDPRIPILKEKIRTVHTTVERNSINAQIQVVIYKNIYKFGINPSLNRKMSNVLEKRDLIIQKDKRNQQDLSGDEPIDVLYREIVEENRQPIQNWPVQNIPFWFEKIWLSQDYALDRLRKQQDRQARHHHDVLPIRTGLRSLSRDANYAVLDRFVQSSREFYYNLGWQNRDPVQDGNQEIPDNQQRVQ